jgi:16S rRNA (guanine(1405)-N(7))-methyltransferase
MTASSRTPLDLLTAQVLESAKYRHVCPDLIRRIGMRELSIRRSLKEAVKETKNTLHQVAGAFAESGLRYDACLERLKLARQDQNPLHFRHTCAEIMERHASTRERLPLLDEFYTVLLGDLAQERPIRSILDVACGLNPLTLPWMPLPPGAVYYACDLYSDLMAFLNGFFTLTEVKGVAEAHDVAATLPDCEVDVALVLKALPPLEQTDKTASLRLLRSLRARVVIVSFPTRTLGGRNKQMETHYETHFSHLIRDEPWTVERFVFPNELCFRLTKPAAAHQNRQRRFAEI